MRSLTIGVAETSLKGFCFGCNDMFVSVKLIAIKLAMERWRNWRGRWKAGLPRQGYVGRFSFDREIR